MLPDAALRSIADNLAALNLDPVLHLKIAVAVAVVGPLMRGASEPGAAETNRNLGQNLTPSRRTRKVRSSSECGLGVCESLMRLTEEANAPPDFHH